MRTQEASNHTRGTPGSLLVVDGTVRTEPRKTFTIGICASDSASNLGSLLEMLENEEFPRTYVLKSIVIVASGCRYSSLALAREFARKDTRITLIEELERHGKAEAINTIIKNQDSDFLVLVNADALPETGAVQALLDAVSSDKRVGIVSARPTFDQRGGITSQVIQLMWTTHNECSRLLNHKGVSNHSSDELMVIRSAALSMLPMNLVNDGAYMGGDAYSRGFGIKFCSEAGVRIEVPSQLMDLIRQRRRITYGHFQVWEMVGAAPKTVESLLFTSPKMGMSIIIRVLAQSPKSILVLPVAVVGEIISTALAVLDKVTSTKKHAVWKRFGD